MRSCVSWYEESKLSSFLKQAAEENVLACLCRWLKGILCSYLGLSVNGQLLWLCSVFHVERSCIWFNFVIILTAAYKC